MVKTSTKAVESKWKKTGEVQALSAGVGKDICQ